MKRGGGGGGAGELIIVGFFLSYFARKLLLLNSVCKPNGRLESGGVRSRHEIRRTYFYRPVLNFFSLKY